MSSSNNSQTQNNKVRMPVSGSVHAAVRRDGNAAREPKKLVDRSDSAVIARKGLAMAAADAALIRAATVNGDTKSDKKINNTTPSPFPPAPQGLRARFPTPPARANPGIKFVGRATDWHGPGVDDLRRSLKEDRERLLARERERQQKEEQEAGEWEMVDDDEEEWVKI